MQIPYADLMKGTCTLRRANSVSAAASYINDFSRYIVQVDINGVGIDWWIFLLK